MEYYSIVWEKDETLGIWFEPHVSQYPVVKKVVNKKYEAQVSLGDMLIAINRKAIVDPFDQLMNILPTIPRPVSLTFERFMKKGGGMLPASAAVAATTLVTAVPTTYRIVWPSGVALGATFSWDPQAQLPQIQTVQADGSKVPGIEQASIGDHLISISGSDTRSRSLEQTLFLLQTLKRPLKLAFRRRGRPTVLCDGDGKDGRNVLEYDVRYSGGKLGLVFIPGATASDPPVVYKVKDKQQLKHARKGDELISIDGKDTRELGGFEASMARMKRIQSRTLLRFRHSGKKVSVTGLIVEALSSMFV